MKEFCHEFFNSVGFPVSLLIIAGAIVLSLLVIKGFDATKADDLNIANLKIACIQAGNTPLECKEVGKKY